MNVKRGIAGTLTAAMLFTSNAFAASVSDFTDFPNDWSATALTHAVENGLLQGSDGKINASGKLTRAEMATIVNRAFSAQATASLDAFSDVNSSDWYSAEFAKSVQMGTFSGSNGQLSPNNAITREEAFTVLSRAFALDAGAASALSSFTDASEVSSWAEGSVAALVSGGYVNGAAGKINPKASITRAEFAQIMDNLVSGYAATAEDVKGDTVSGNLVITKGGITLSGVTINGDLILADGVSADSVNLENVTVTGRIVVRGGNVDMKTSKSGSVVVKNMNAASAVSSDTALTSVALHTDATLKANVTTVTVKDTATVTVASGTVDKIVVDSAAASSKVTVAKDATVTAVDANAASTSVSGEGKVTTVNASANDVTVTTPSTKVVAGTGTTGVSAAGTSVPAGETGTISNDGKSATVTKTVEAEKPKETNSSGGPSSPSSPSSSTRETIKVSNWAELCAAAEKATTSTKKVTISLTKDITDAGYIAGKTDYRTKAEKTAANETVVDAVSTATVTLKTDNVILDGNNHTISAADISTDTVDGYNNKDLVSRNSFCFNFEAYATKETGADNKTITTYYPTVVTVKNLTIESASFTNKLGGAAFAQRGVDVTFNNVKFNNCAAKSTSATNGGAAIYVNNHGNSGTKVTVSNCEFNNNAVNDGNTGRGGAIYANNTSDTQTMTLSVTNSTFTGNKAAANASIAVVGNVNTTITGNTFDADENIIDVLFFEGQAQSNRAGVAQSTEVTLAGKMNAVVGRYYGLSNPYEKRSDDAIHAVFGDSVTITEYANPERTVPYVAAETPATIAAVEPAFTVSNGVYTYTFESSDYNTDYINAAYTATLTIGDSAPVTITAGDVLTYRAASVKNGVSTESAFVVKLDPNSKNESIKALFEDGVLKDGITVSITIQARDFADLTLKLTTVDSFAAWALPEDDSFKSFVEVATDTIWDQAVEMLTKTGNSERKTALLEKFELESTASNADIAAALATPINAMCSTVDEGVDAPAIKSVAFVGNAITFTFTDGATMAQTYILEKTVAGVLGETTYVLKSTTASADNLYSYVALAEPGTDEGQNLMHFHFRYGATEKALNLDVENYMWYPTMVTNKTATDDNLLETACGMYNIKVIID